jgi:hypothetical protein
MQLQNLNWTDKRTRAIVIEFAVYNPNINVFAYCTILFEFLPTGSVIKQIHFSSFSLYDTGASAFYLFFDFMYIVIIALFMIREIISLVQKRKLYFKEGWNYMKWLMFALTWAAFVLYLYRLYARYDLLGKISTIKSSNSRQYISFHGLNYWNDIMMGCLGLCAFIATMLFMKMFTYSRSLKMMTTVLQRSLFDVANFSFVIFILMSGFICYLFVTFNTRNSKYSTLVKAIEESFMVVMAKFQNTCNIPFNSPLEPLMICLFAITVTFATIRMLFDIVMRCYSRTRLEYLIDKDKEDSVLSKYIQSKVARLFGRKIAGSDLQKNIKYKDYVDSFELKIAELIDKVNQIHSM